MGPIFNGMPVCFFVFVLLSGSPFGGMISVFFLFIHLFTVQLNDSEATRAQRKTEEERQKSEASAKKLTIRERNE